MGVSCLLADLSVTPSRKRLECIVVACIGSVEIFSIQEYASKRDGSLDVSLKVFGVLNPVEGVAGVIAK